MKIALSFEKTSNDDLNIMVDALRASSTITLALNNFNEIIPCFSPEEAILLGGKNNSVIAGERSGVKVEGFDIGNSPKEVENFKIPSNKSKTLILTTSNGTRILENTKSTTLIGSMLNAKAVALKAIELASKNITVVMAGYKGNFALEDFLVSGEIIYWIKKQLNSCELTDYAKASVLASRDYEKVCDEIHNSQSGIRLQKIGHSEDIDCCILKNITDNVGIYKDNKIKLL